jgi:ABC-type transport system involved in multi-copper enzyme maturation permease subunit
VLTQNPSRVTVITARAAAIAAGLLAISVATVLATGAASTGVALLSGRDLAWPPLSTLLVGVGATWLISMAAASLGMFLATLFRNTAAAVGAGLVWLLAVENLVSALAGTITSAHGVQQVLLGPSGGSLASALGSAAQDDGGVPGVIKVSAPGTACAVLAGYVVLFVGLSALVTSRRDAR